MKNQTEVLSRWPRIVGHLIAESLGYFTPRDAANAIISFKKGKPYWCEWYIHLASFHPGDREFGVIDAGCKVLRNAIRKRHAHKGFMSNYGLARQVVKEALEGREPLLASWF